MKTWRVFDRGKTISKHKSFYLAQVAVSRHLINRKISNNYEIVPTRIDYCPYHPKTKLDEAGECPECYKKIMNWKKI